MKPVHPNHDNILNFWAMGETSPAIAARYPGMQGAAVRVIVQRARKRGDTRATKRGQSPASYRLACSVEYSDLSKLRAEAQRRGIRMGELLQLLVELIVADNLFDAVLGEQPRAAA